MGSDRLEELCELLRIESVSADPTRATQVQDAAEWVAGFLRRSGGEARLVEGFGRPLVWGRLRAATCGPSPVVLCYGHVDVQPPGPSDAWTFAPFEPTVRDGWLYARGVADDKGQLWTLLRAAADLTAAGELPVDVLFCCDAEEEVGGAAVVDFLDRERPPVDACVIFDTPMLDRETPVVTLSTRGTLYLHVEVRTGERDLHSGIYGGAALNALHVLVRVLGAVAPHGGRLPDELRMGALPPSEAERNAWSRLVPGAALLASQGAPPADPAAADEFYLRTWVEPSIDVNGLEGGSPVQLKTIVPAAARANLSMRLAPGQRVDQVLPALEALLRGAAPVGAHLEVTVSAACDPGCVQSDSPAVLTALGALERMLGKRPLLLRSGGSLPLMPQLERLGIPAIVTGFGVPESNVHAPDERMPLDHLAVGVAAAKELFRSFAAL
jgi:acetylornithine deacetylase/succinyl-diaminopimelate desuccinylase-like protein